MKEYIATTLCGPGAELYHERKLECSIVIFSAVCIDKGHKVVKKRVRCTAYQSEWSNDSDDKNTSAGQAQFSQLFSASTTTVLMAVACTDIYY